MQWTASPFPDANIGTLWRRAIGSVIVPLLHETFFVRDVRERGLEHREGAVGYVAKIPV